jgi:hypothetical protein
MCCARVALVVGALALGAGGGRSRAEPPRAAPADGLVGIALRYDAPPGCPERDAAAAMILARAPSLGVAAASAPLGDPAARRPRAVLMRIAAEPAGYRGEVVIAAAPSRPLAAARCEDVVAALALVAALAIDGAAPGAAAAEPRLAPGAAAAEPRLAPGAAAAEPPPAPSVRAPAGRASAASAIARAPAAPERRWAVEGAAAAAVGVGATPDALLGGGAFGRASRGRLAVELGLELGRDGTRAGEAAAVLSRALARPAACALARAGRATLGACAAIDVGAVRAAGDRIVNARAVTRLWLAAGAYGDARWPAAGRWFGLVRAGLAAPIVRDRYRFMPGIVIHDTAAVTGWVSAGVGVRFR